MFDTGHQSGHLRRAGESHVFVKAVRRDATARQAFNLQGHAHRRFALGLNLMSGRLALKAQPGGKRLQAVTKLGAKF